MAQQPQKNSASRWINLFITYAIFLVIFNFFFLRNQKPPAPTVPLLQQAQQLENEGRHPAPNVSKADWVKKLEQASQKYEEFYNQNKNNPDGWKARFAQVNIYDYLTTVDGKSVNTHWFDLSEQKLKDMEQALHGKVGTVTIEESGQSREQTQDLGDLASERLAHIQAARDTVNSRQPWWHILDFFVGLTGRNPNYSYFLALLIIVVVLKAATYPFQKKQFQYSRDMLRIQPKIKELQEKMKERPAEEMQRRMMQLYKEENVNLAGGCLPMAGMMVVLWPMFFMVRAYEYQFSHAHFLWVGSPLSHQVWWMATSLAKFDLPLFIIYLVSMAGYTFLQPPPPDPQQAQQMKIMGLTTPLIFGWFMYQQKWSSAFMLYWLILNIVSMYQSWRLNRHFGPPSAPAAGSAGSGGGSRTPLVPATPLEPMKGMQPRRPVKSKRNGRASGGVDPSSPRRTGQAQDS